MKGRRWTRGILSGVLFVAPLAFFGFRHQRADDRLLLPGKTSDGHHQIEQRCESCHTPFGGVAQDACTRCHGSSLRQRGDTHAVALFDDPGRAADLAFIDARACASCHREHRPEAQTRGSVTVPANFCFPCHATVGQDRPSHGGFAADSCANAGCHNYHDNRALHGAFLLRHKDDPALKATPRLPVESRRHDAPPSAAPGHAVDVQAEWAASAHGRASVACEKCHQDVAPEILRAGAAFLVRGEKSHGDSNDEWQVADNTCATCHAAERDGFVSGKHGMRIADGLGPMSPGLARAKMKPDVSGTTVGCTSCHGAHRFDRVQAAVSACESCHDDDHTRAYRQSPHFVAWEKERAQKAPAGTGVSCASCHLPRFTTGAGDATAVHVQHNQNGNLRPTDRMVRDVCLHCHGLPFSLAALADPALVKRNFVGAPAAVTTGMTLVKREARE
ncbi:MAG TPA: cytochrome c3 family protein [Polyangia bacterium]